MIASALALCVAGTQAAAIAHFAFVRHGTCPEHGLVVHASVHHRSHSQGLTETGAGALAQADGEEGSDHAHDHCLASLRRDGAGNLDGRSQSPVGSLGEPLAPAPVDAPAASAGVWRVAPKQSPPVA